MKVWKRIPPLSGRKWRAIRNGAGILALLTIFSLYFGQITIDPVKAAQVQERYELLEPGEPLATFKTRWEAYVVSRAPDNSVRLMELDYVDQKFIGFLHYKYDNTLEIEQSKDGVALFYRSRPDALIAACDDHAAVNAELTIDLEYSSKVYTREVPVTSGGNGVFLFDIETMLQTATDELKLPLYTAYAGDIRLTGLDEFPYTLRVYDAAGNELEVWTNV